MMKNYYFFMTGCEHWLEVALKLKEKQIANPILWLGDPVHLKKARTNFGNAVVDMVETREFIYNLKDIEYGGQFIEFWSSENYIRAKDRCMKMLDRIDLYAQLSRKDAEIYFQNLVMWALKYLSENYPDVLIMTESPHSHNHYLIYEICLFFGIPMFRFNHYYVGPMIYLIRYDTGKLIKKNLLNTSCGEKLLEGIELFCKAVVENAKVNESKYLPKYLKSQIDNLKLINIYSRIKNQILPELILEIKYDIKRLIRYGKKMKGYDPVNPFQHSFLSRLFIKNKLRKILNEEINKLENKTNFKEQFVYFPLCFEPERTTNPDGGQFHDQLLAINHIREIFPNEIKIVVKEHPSQLFINKGYKGRSPLFYKALLNITNLEVVGIESNSLELIKNSIAVASITGSVAIEGALLGKKAIVFGETWYDGAPNIFFWNENLKYEDIINSHTYQSEEISKYLTEKAKAVCVPGTPVPSYEKLNKPIIDSIHDYHKESINGIISLLEEAFRSI